MMKIDCKLYFAFIVSMTTLLNSNLAYGKQYMYPTDFSFSKSIDSNSFDLVSEYIPNSNNHNSKDWLSIQGIRSQTSHFSEYPEAFKRLRGLYRGKKHEIDSLKIRTNVDPDINWLELASLNHFADSALIQLIQCGGDDWVNYYFNYNLNDCEGLEESLNKLREKVFQYSLLVPKASILPGSYDSTVLPKNHHGTLEDFEGESTIYLDQILISGPYFNTSLFVNAPVKVDFYDMRNIVNFFPSRSSQLFNPLLLQMLIEISSLNLLPKLYKKNYRNKEYLGFSNQFDTVKLKAVYSKAHRVSFVTKFIHRSEAFEPLKMLALQQIGWEVSTADRQKLQELPEKTRNFLIAGINSLRTLYSLSFIVSSNNFGLSPAKTFRYFVFASADGQELDNFLSGAYTDLASNLATPFFDAYTNDFSEFNIEHGFRELIDFRKLVKKSFPEMETIKLK